MILEPRYCSNELKVISLGLKLIESGKRSFSNSFCYCWLLTIIQTQETNKLVPLVVEHRLESKNACTSTHLLAKSVAIAPLSADLSEV